MTMQDIGQTSPAVSIAAPLPVEDPRTMNPSTSLEAPFEVESSAELGSDSHEHGPVPQLEAPHHNWNAKHFLMDWAFSLLIGALVVGYWRGGWTLMDMWDCQQPNSASLAAGDTFCFAADIRATTRRDTAFRSYWIGLLWLLVAVTLMWSGFWQQSILARLTTKPSKGPYPLAADMQYFAAAFIRCFAIYSFGTAAIHVWRGIWYGIDYFVLYNDPVKSWWCTTIVGICGAFLMCAGDSLLAPPSIFLLDGPSRGGTPPVGGTILSAYYSKITPVKSEGPRALPKAWYAIDIVGSFIVLPIFVLGFWRGCWGLQDHYFWGFADDDDALNMSMLFSLILALACFAIGSDDAYHFLPSSFHRNGTTKAVAIRFKKLFLAVGTCAYWRFVWYLWDAHLGGPTFASAWISHVLGVVGLAALGCLSSIAAPPSTVGVDVLEHPEAAVEPLFRTLPLPAQDSLHPFAIARQSPLALQTSKTPEATDTEDESFSTFHAQQDALAISSFEDVTV